LAELSKNARSTVSCFYLPFGTSESQDDDSHVTFLQPKRLFANQPFPVEHETFIVNCTTADGKISVYENLHAHPLIKNNKDFAEATEDRLSIELIVVESVSMAQFRRKMPATFDYVTDKMKMFMLKSRVLKS